MIKNNEIKKFYYSLLPGLSFVFILWFIKILELAFNTHLHRMGIFPREAKGVLGIVTSPLIHSDLEHLFSNTFPVIILSAGIIYFYPKIAFKVFTWIYIATGVWVWAFARQNYHIGASGLIYGFASFLFFSGIFRKNRQLMAISLLVIFLYGSLVWGVFPINPRVSHETHLLGAVMGLIVAYSFRKEGLILKPTEEISTINFTTDEPYHFVYEYQETKNVTGLKNPDNQDLAARTSQTSTVNSEETSTSEGEACL